MPEEPDLTMKQVREVIMRNDLDLGLLRSAALLVMAASDNATLRDLARIYLRLKTEQDSARQQNP